MVFPLQKKKVWRKFIIDYAQKYFSHNTANKYSHISLTSSMTETTYKEPLYFEG